MNKIKWLIGLGNPGARYKKNRHNLGWQVLDSFFKVYPVAKKERHAKAHLFFTRAERFNVCGVYPRTFMNESGLALGWLKKKHAPSIDDILLIHDDMDIELGRFKLRLGGRPAGHRGVESVAGIYGNNDIQRLKMGISRPPPGLDSKDYVLSDFTGSEKDELKPVLELMPGVIMCWIKNGLQKSMSLYNRKQQ